MNILEMKGAKEFLERTKSENMWTGSNNEEWSKINPKSKGHIGESVAKGKLEELFGSTEAPGTTHFDIKAGGMRVEIKTSSLWKGGIFKYQEIRTNQEYDVLLFVSVTPETVFFHWCMKSDIVGITDYQHSEDNRSYTAKGFLKEGKFPSVMRELKEGNVWTD